MIRSADPTDFQPDDARFFEAVRYLLDEMNSEEAERFEDQLAVDQSLREILAEAVLVTHATYAAQLSPDGPAANEPQPVELAKRPAAALPHGAAPRSDHSLPGMLLALAAALFLAAAGGLWLLGLGNNMSDVANDASSEQIQLASAWVERLEDQSQENATLWDDDLLAASTMELSSETEDDTLLDDAPMDPPAWMLKALAAQQEDSPAGPTM